MFGETCCLFVGGDIGRVRDKRSTGSGDSYRVLLLDDERHSEKLGRRKLHSVQLNST